MFFFNSQNANFLNFSYRYLSSFVSLHFVEVSKRLIFQRFRHKLFCTHSTMKKARSINLAFFSYFSSYTVTRHNPVLPHIGRWRYFPGGITLHRSTKNWFLIIRISPSPPKKQPPLAGNVIKIMALNKGRETKEMSTSETVCSFS